MTTYQDIEKHFLSKGINDPAAIAWHVITLLAWRINGDWAALITAPDPGVYLDQTVYPWTRELTGLDWLMRPDGVNYRAVLPLIDAFPMPDDQDVLGDIYEAGLSNFGTAGKIGFFRTPAHIARFMVGLGQPQPGEVVSDPAIGSGSLLLPAAESGGVPVGGDLSPEMVALARLNLHRFGGSVDICDFLADDTPASVKAALYLANPPFNAENGKGNGKTEVHFLERLLDTMAPGSRMIILLPAGVTFNGQKKVKALRQRLLGEFDLQAVISLPSGVFLPYTGVVTTVLVVQAQPPRSDQVWFMDIKADGFSLNNKRTPVKDNDLPMVLAAARRWIETRHPPEDERGGWVASKAEITANAHTLTPSHYKPFSLDLPAGPPVTEQIRGLMGHSRHIMTGLDNLAAMVESI